MKPTAILATVIASAAVSACSSQEWNKTVCKFQTPGGWRSFDIQWRKNPPEVIVDEVPPPPNMPASEIHKQQPAIISEELVEIREHDGLVVRILLKTNEFIISVPNSAIAIRGTCSPK